MILSASRRTDIPAFFPKWFIQRIREGFVLVRNPMNYHQISRIELSPNLVDCIVFWTKNAKPIFPYLKEIAEKYPFYFQYTLNAYGRDVEPHLPLLSEKINSLQKLSQEIGKERVIWRYDPILLSPKYDVDWHIETFDRLAKELSPYVENCVFSFLDLYKTVEKNIRECGARTCSEVEMIKLADKFAAIGKFTHLQLRTCAEKIDLTSRGIQHNKCIDPELISRITGYEIQAAKDKNQREECGCVESVDIGQYNTCRHNCCYCYANFNLKSVSSFTAQHDDMSPLLVGNLSVEDKVTVRKLKTLKVRRNNSAQLNLWD